MKAALALVFLACIAGSMASDARIQIVDQLVQQGQAVAQSVFSMVQQQVMALLQQAVGQLTQLFGSSGRFDFSQLLEIFKPLATNLINQALGQVMGGLQNLIGGGRGALDILSTAFNQLLSQLQGVAMSLGQHALNQGLAAVLGGLGGRGLFDSIFGSLTQQFGPILSGAQAALQGALGNLAAIGSGILDASKPHLEQLQEQLVGHGLNVLGSLSETINNLHGSVLSGGR